MQAPNCSPSAHSEPLAPQLAGERPFSHRAWLHCVTAARRQGIHTPTVRVQVRKAGETLCGCVIEPTNPPGSQVELYRVDLVDLGRTTVQARNCRACPPASCWCRKSPA